jgi:eukaryotic-like serine/threonine-protein kinase
VYLENLEQIHDGGQSVILGYPKNDPDHNLVIKASNPLKPRSGQALKHEIKLLKSMEYHPFVIPLIDSGQSEGRIYYTMPLLGKSTRKLIPLIQNSNRSNVSDILIKICEGLAALHEANILHLDIKPDNILMKHSGHPVIIDFGLSKNIESGLTEPHSVPEGSFRYIAPEIWLHTPMSVRTDIYSFGITAYEIITGNTFVNGDSLEQIRRQHLSKIRPMLERQDLLMDLAYVILKCTRLNPADRFFNIHEVQQAIRDRSNPTLELGTS